MTNKELRQVANMVKLGTMEFCAKIADRNAQLHRSRTAENIAKEIRDIALAQAAVDSAYFDVHFAKSAPGLQAPHNIGERDPSVTTDYTGADTVIAELRSALTDCLDEIGFHHFTDDELQREERRGNYRAGTVLKARRALAVSSQERA